MNPWDELWNEGCLKKEVEDYFGEFDESRWSLDGGISGDMVRDTQNFNHHTPGFVYQAAWNCAINLEKDKYTTIRDTAKTRKIAKALDYGCGIGSGVITLALEGILVIGAEINKHCLGFLDARISRFGLQTAEIWDMHENTPIDEAGKFDMIVCTEVFEHLENPHEITKKLVGMINPGGIAVFSWSFVPMVGHLPQHFHLQAPHPDQLLTMGFGKFMQDGLGMKFEKYTWFNNMLWRKE